MGLRFSMVCAAASTVCFALALVWLLAPEWLLTLWGLELSVSAAVVARRSAALFLGFGLVLGRMRRWGAGPLRTTVADAFSVACSALAALGLAEWWAGNVNEGILLAVAAELVLAMLLFASVRRDTASPANETTAA